MDETILSSVKKVLGLSPDYNVFDQDIIMFINGVFVTLSDLGVGPENGFMITDDEKTWEEFLPNDNRLNQIKIFVCLSVRMIFDPPQSPPWMEAMVKQIDELAWRITRRHDPFEGTLAPLVLNTVPVELT